MGVVYVVVNSSDRFFLKAYVDFSKVRDDLLENVEE